MTLQNVKQSQNLESLLLTPNHASSSFNFVKSKTQNNGFAAASDLTGSFHSESKRFSTLNNYFEIQNPLLLPE